MIPYLGIFVRTANSEISDALPSLMLKPFMGTCVNMWDMENFEIRILLYKQPPNCAHTMTYVSTYSRHKKPEDNQSKEPPCITSGQALTADQAQGHFENDDENEHMKEVSIWRRPDDQSTICWCDGPQGWSRHSKTMFHYCSPFVLELFHSKMFR